MKYVLCIKYTRFHYFPVEFNWTLLFQLTKKNVPSYWIKNKHDEIERKRMFAENIEKQVTIALI